MARILFTININEAVNQNDPCLKEVYFFFDKQLMFLAVGVEQDKLNKLVRLMGGHTNVVHWLKFVLGTLETNLNTC